MYNFAQCLGCGMRWEIPGKKPNLKARCDSCRATRVESIEYEFGECFPWGGDFDLNDNPMLHGEYYLAGYRTCGHRDCVNVEHILPFK